jgi:hypothetical protein
MIKRPEKIAAIRRGVGGRSISQNTTGNSATPMIEPSEMYRLNATTAAKIRATTPRESGAIYKKAPTKQATAFPPLKFRNAG